jgi:hypothetical protein
MSTTNTLRAEAEARATARLFRTELAKKAMTEYQAAQKAQDANTARLRALRLAKEAKDAEEAAEAKGAKPKAKAKAASKR